MTHTADGTVTPTAEHLFDELVAVRLLAPERVVALREQFVATSSQLDRDDLMEFLVQAGHFTPFQAEKILQGQATKLILGPYQLLEMIGSGSFGQVYLAQCVGKRGRFAVKQLPLRSMWNVLQAKKQVNAFHTLPPHSAIVPFVDIDTAGGSHYLVWPFVEGETFESIVARSGPQHPDHVVKWSIEILQGLEICHKANIAHGLLKPGNLILGRDRKAKILDLGIGAILSENISDDESMMDTISTSNTAMSTIDCSPPESLANPTVRTATGDLYSFGCVLHYLLSGAYPFPDGNIVDKMIAHQLQLPQPLHEFVPDMPVALSEIVSTLLAKNPADRPSNYAKLIEDLKAAAPNSARLSVDDIPSEPKQTLPEAPLPQVWEAEVVDKVPQSYHGNSEDSINFDEAFAPTEPLSNKYGGRLPGPQDSAAVNYFDLADETPRGLATGKVTQMKSAPRTINKPAHTVVPDLEEAARKIVLPTQVQEKSNKRPAPTKPTANVSELELPSHAIQWATVEEFDNVEFTLPPVIVPPPPKTSPSLLTVIRRRLLFWLPPYDQIQLSIFGPTQLTPGQTYQFQICAHTPEAFAGVRTLSRAFQADAELRAAGYTERTVRRGDEIGLHLAVANAGVARSLLRFQWVGQAKPWKFEVYIPWESPPGRTPGMLSVGLGDETIAQIPFNVVVLPRSA